jgi:predicted DNA-binding transcriptional regulator YafY
MGDCQLRSGLGQTRHMHLVMLAHNLLMRQLRQRRAVKWALGTATVTLRADGLDEIIWWLLGWAGFATVVRPERLREMFVAQLRAGLVENERPAAP